MESNTHAPFLLNTRVTYKDIQDTMPWAVPLLTRAARKSQSKSRTTEFDSLDWQLLWRVDHDRTRPWHTRITEVKLFGQKELFLVRADAPTGETPPQIWGYLKVTDPNECEWSEEEVARRRQDALDRVAIRHLDNLVVFPDPWHIKTITLAMRDGSTRVIELPEYPSLINKYPEGQ